jgi:hypothetical protein
MTEFNRLAAKAGQKSPSGWDLNRLAALLKEQLEEIGRRHPAFFGTLKIEVNFREGEIETVAIDRRQTFKD